MLRENVTADFLFQGVEYSLIYRIHFWGLGGIGIMSLWIAHQVLRREVLFGPNVGLECVFIVVTLFCDAGETARLGVVSLGLKT